MAPRANAGVEIHSTADLSSLLRGLASADRRASAAIDRLDETARAFSQDAARLLESIRAVDEGLSAMHLLPVASLFAPLDRVVRDAARETRKEAQLSLDGGDVEVDRAILEQLRFPLVHMVRNSVDHGIEPPDVRGQLGKPRCGTIRISASRQDTALQMCVEDDGAGLDPVALRRAAVDRGILPAERAMTLDDQAAIDLIFQPGFSTAIEPTMHSGRGVGMDAVRTAVEQQGGQIRVTSMPGRGTRLIIDLRLGS